MFVERDADSLTSHNSHNIITSSSHFVIAVSPVNGCLNVMSLVCYFSNVRIPRRATNFRSIGITVSKRMLLFQLFSPITMSRIISNTSKSFTPVTTFCVMSIANSFVRVCMYACICMSDNNFTRYQSVISQSSTYIFP